MIPPLVSLEEYDAVGLARLERMQRQVIVVDFSPRNPQQTPVGASLAAGWYERTKPRIHLLDQRHLES